LIHTLAMAVAASPASAQDRSAPDSVEQVLAHFDGDPTIREVQLWATAAAHASPAQVRRWLRQSRSFAALPELTIDGGMRLDWDQGFDYADPYGAEPLPQDDLVTVPLGVDQGWTQELQLRLRWHLGDLVMSSERIRVVDEVQDVVKLRNQVLSEVTRTYFERRRLQVEMWLAPRIDLASRTADQIRLAELTAALDALTDGAFSRASGS
jgi:hypothetical protein